MNNYYKVLYVAFILFLCLPLIVRLQFPTVSSLVFATIIKNIKINLKVYKGPFKIKLPSVSYSVYPEFVYFVLGLIILSILFIIGIYIEPEKRNRTVLLIGLLLCIGLLALIVLVSHQSFSFKGEAYYLFEYTTISLVLLSLLCFDIALYIYYKKERLTEFVVIAIIGLCLIGFSRLLAIKLVHDIVYGGATNLLAVLTKNIYTFGLGITSASFIYIVIDLFRNREESKKASL